MRGSSNGTLNHGYYKATGVGEANDIDATKLAKMQTALREPKGYTGIFAKWNDLDADSNTV